jgi:hypothetical protein
MVSIRDMIAEDVSAAGVLLVQLGYELDVVDVQRRYDAVAQALGHALFVAEPTRGQWGCFISMRARIGEAA